MASKATLITEAEMLDRLRNARRVFLLEPDYQRSLPPVGLARIAAYVRAHGGDVHFGRYYDGTDVDLICVTSLFTYDMPDVDEAITMARMFAPGVPIMLGGVAASLTGRQIPGVDLFEGVSPVLDSYPPDYSVDWQADPRWQGWSFVFTSRGCCNRCRFCAAWRIEGEQRVIENWREQIVAEHSRVMISDNNLLASQPEHRDAVLDYLAQLERGVAVDFNGGIDCRLLDDHVADKLAQVRVVQDGIRLAFDSLDVDGILQPAVERLLARGVKPWRIMVYVLFNWRDTPADALYRMNECKRLGVRPYPQMYQPLRAGRRSPRGCRAGEKSDLLYCGKYWTPRLGRAFRLFWHWPYLWREHDFEQWVRTPEALEAMKNKTPLAEEDFAPLALPVKP